MTTRSLPSPTNKRIHSLGSAKVGVKPGALDVDLFGWGGKGSRGIGLRASVLLFVQSFEQHLAQRLLQLLKALFL